MSLRPVLVRLVHSLITLWAITVLFFVITELMPGDFASATATRDTTREMIEATRFELGLYTSAPARYLNWLTGLLSGDLGTSWWLRKPITPFIAERLWHSVWLVSWATILTVPLSLAFAIVAVAWHRGLFDRVSSITALTAMSFPDFLIAYGLMSLLAVHFRIFPVFTIFTHDMSVLDRLYGSAMPILSLAAVTITPMFRLSRAALVNVMSMEYIQMAQLKGLGRWRVLLWHALPNAVGPIANAIVLALANLFFGLVIIEGIFQYPGMGQLLLAAVSNRDIPLVQACALLTAALYIGFNFLADAVGILANPKLRYPSAPVKARWIPREWLETLFANWKAATAAMVAVALGVGWITVLSADRVESSKWTELPKPTSSERSELTATELLGETPVLGRFVHYDYFKPYGSVQEPKHSLQGELHIPRLKVRRRRAGQELATSTAHFPAITAQFVMDDNVLLPTEHGRLLMSQDGAWYIILSPGRAWHEPADGDWSRGAFAFTLTGVSSYAAHYGVATFLFNDNTVSQIRIQIAQETANWAQYDVWGQTKVMFVPGSVAGARSARDDYARQMESRLNVRPWSELAAKHWRSLESFDGKGNRHNIAVSGLMVDDTFYLRPCRTRAGLHPYCRDMRFGVFSISKSLGAAISMLWLAQKYGPQIFDERITDHVSIPAQHDGWNNVTFGNALDMASGIGNVMPFRVDRYVEADQTAIGNRVWRTRSIREKLDAIAAFKNYPWGPGEVTRYRSTDTTALTAAMESYLRSREGPEADLWQSLTRDVFAPLGINRLPVRRSIEPNGRPGTPLLAGGCTRQSKKR